MPIYDLDLFFEKFSMKNLQFNNKKINWNFFSLKTFVGVVENVGLIFESNIVEHFYDAVLSLFNEDNKNPQKPLASRCILKDLPVSYKQPRFEQSRCMSQKLEQVLNQHKLCAASDTTWLNERPGTKTNFLKSVD